MLKSFIIISICFISFSFGSVISENNSLKNMIKQNEKEYQLDKKILKEEIIHKEDIIKQYHKNLTSCIKNKNGE